MATSAAVRTLATSTYACPSRKTSPSRSRQGMSRAPRMPSFRKISPRLQGKPGVLLLGRGSSMTGLNQKELSSRS